jgi:hypothetical protein
MTVHLLITVPPKHGREQEVISTSAELRAVMAAHAPLVHQWRATIAGPTTGNIYSVMSWPTNAAMAASMQKLQADPAYQALQRHFTGDTASASREISMGRHVPGFEADTTVANTTGTPRVSAMILYPYTDEVLELLPSLKEQAHKMGYGWACDMWAIGTGPALITVCNVHRDFAAFGAMQDKLAAEPNLALMKKVRPHILGRSIMSELL